MKVASFFALSLGLHAGALAYPVSFVEQRQLEIIHVAFLPMERESADAGRDRGNGKAAQTAPQSAGRAAPNVQPRGKTRPLSEPEPKASAVEAVPKTMDRSTPLVSDFAEWPESHGRAPLGITGNGFDGVSAEKSGTDVGKAGGGSGFGSDDAGSGTGYGTGQGSGLPVKPLTEARFRHTPQPEYPEAARRNGTEGRVLLRVLVDEEGRSKAVEISLSSGSRLLDQAAAEAVKRWRFSPARYGDSPTPSWVRIPVDFRLKEAK
jgi:TonB family protein